LSGDVRRTPKARRRAWLSRAGALVTVACLVFLARRLAHDAGELPPLVFRWQALGALVVATVLMVANGAIAAVTWRLLIRSVDARVTWRDAYAVCGRSQIAKYLPGNGLHFVQQVAMARTDRVTVPGAAVVTVVSALAVAAAAAIVGVPAYERVLSLLPPSSAGRLGWISLCGVAICALAAVLVWRKVRSVGPFLAGVLHPRRILVAVLLDVVPFLVAGFAVFLLLHGIWPGASTLGCGELVPGFALAFLLGYVTPGSPGGIGIREAVLYGLFAPTLGSGLAAGLFVLARMVFTMADVLTFFAASYVHRTRSR
jgi:glycosyltransferase 2 family protein